MILYRAGQVLGAPTDGSNPAVVVRVGALNVGVSEDGRYLGYEITGEEERGVIITDLVTGEETEIAAEGSNFRFYGWRPGIIE